MVKIWHPYFIWEDYQSGMWNTISGKERKPILDKAIEFTGDHNLYGSFMLKVLNMWKISCEHNLSDVNQNRKAWIGHAACFIAIGSPEDITREAWAYLTKQQQDDANSKAEFAIKQWELNYETEDKTLYKQMAFAGI